MMDSVTRFSNRVENYVKYRPHYPTAVIDHLTDAIGMTPDVLIADIGCGTGISSKLFLENGNAVIGVEPNDAMRSAAEEYLAGFPRFRTVGATAEATTLASGSVDMILAGQAFHWFDLKRAKPEFKRVLSPGGHGVLMWNERRLDATPFLVAYEQFVLKYSRDYAVVRHDTFDEKVIGGFFDGTVSKAVFDNVQDLDFEGLRGRILSASYMPNEQDEGYAEMIGALQTLFAKHNESDRIKILYDTNVYISQG